MTWNQGTSTDYIDLLDQLVQIATSRHLSTVAINAAGTGYVAGEILGITGTGATATHLATIEIVTVGGSGEITAARVYTGGAYTVDPTTTSGNAATGGSGSGATFDLVFADTGWTQTRRSAEAVSAVVAGGGTGYANGNTLTLVGGVLAQGGSAATFTVASNTGGVIDTVTLATAGHYEVPPSGAVQVTGGAGTGATLTLTTQDVAGDTIVVLVGDSGGSTPDPVIGIKTFQLTDESNLNTSYTWAIFGATADSSSLRLDQFSNVSPGFNTATLDGQITGTITGDGAFFPLKDADAFDMSFWVSITGRRIHLVASVEAASTLYYPSMTAGLLNSPGVASEFPYPLYVCGSSDRRKVWYRDTNSLFGGIVEVISRNNGPAFVWDTSGFPVEVKVGAIGSNTSLSPTYNEGNSAPRCGLWPLATFDVHELTADQTWGVANAVGFDNLDLFDVTPTLIYRTPNTGEDLFPLFPATVLRHDSSTDTYICFGEIDGVYWFDIEAVSIASEDRIDQDGVFYRVFQNGTRTAHHSFFALRED